MGSFVMVMNGVTAEHLEKLLAIQARSGNKVRFVPQGNNSGSGVVSPALQEAQVSSPQNAAIKTSVFNNVRVEWSESGAHAAREVFDLFIKGEHREERAG